MRLNDCARFYWKVSCICTYLYLILVYLWLSSYIYLYIHYLVAIVANRLQKVVPQMSLQKSLYHLCITKIKVVPIHWLEVHGNCSCNSLEKLLPHFVLWVRRDKLLLNQIITLAPILQLLSFPINVSLSSISNARFMLKNNMWGHIYCRSEWNTWIHMTAYKKTHTYTQISKLISL